MPEKKANAYFIRELLDLLSEADVLRFSKAFPEQMGAVSSYWSSKREINIDEFLHKDLNVLIRYLDRCYNLKTLKYKKKNAQFEDCAIPQYIAHHCRSLEVLDVSALHLLPCHLKSFSTLTTLKKINFRMSIFTKELVTIFRNNPQIEDVCLTGQVTEDTFRSIPKNIKKFEFHNDFNEPSDLFENIALWKLERLSLRGITLSLQDIRSLHTQDNLTSIDLTYNGKECEFEVLFANNQRLDDVTIRSLYSAPFKGSCLKMLPPGVKKLSIHTDSTIEKDHLIDFLKNRDIEELQLEDRHNKYEFLAELLTFVPNLKKLRINCLKCAAGHLRAIGQLKQLKCLRLTGLTEKHGAALKEISRKCFTLEKLALAPEKITVKTNRMMAYNTAVLIAMAGLPRLKKLHLDIIRGSESLQTFLHYLATSQTLNSVKFTGCQNITNNNLLVLLRGCESLKEIKMRWCTGIKGSLPREVTDVLSKLPNRKNLFHLKLDAFREPIDIPPSGLHPLLQLRLSVREW